MLIGKRQRGLKGLRRHRLSPKTDHPYPDGCKVMRSRYSYTDRTSCPALNSGKASGVCKEIHRSWPVCGDISMPILWPVCHPSDQSASGIFLSVSRMATLGIYSACIDRNFILNGFNPVTTFITGRSVCCFHRNLKRDVIEKNQQKYYCPGDLPLPWGEYCWHNLSPRIDIECISTDKLRYEIYSVFSYTRSLIWKASVVWWFYYRCSTRLISYCSANSLPRIWSDYNLISRDNEGIVQWQF